MVLKDMYKGLVNSPETKITIGLSDVDTTMTVDNIAAIPAAPNLLTIGGDTENPETVKVISISGSVVTIERGFQGVARLWPIGTRVSRNFTEYDHNTFIENIKTLKTSTDENADDILELMSYVGSLDNLETVEKSNLVLALNEIYQGLVAHKAEKATLEKLGHIKVGANLSVELDGTLNAESGGFSQDIAPVRIGFGSSTTGSYATALGENASANYNATALGRKAIAGNYAIALGGNASADSGGTTLGSGSSTTGDYAIALGRAAIANNNNEGVLGRHDTKWLVPGDFSVSGTKNFEIPHPKPDKSATHVIRHGAVESPSAGDTLYRYKVKSTKANDIQTIDLPDYFIHLNKDVQIFVTPQGHFGNGYGNLDRNTEQLELHCQLEGEYNVLVIGTRNDDHQSVQDWDIKGVERETGESWTGETYMFEVDEITETEEIKEVI